jgi:hypothetical protein
MLVGLLGGLDGLHEVGWDGKMLEIVDCYGRRIYLFTNV